MTASREGETARVERWRAKQIRKYVVAGLDPDEADELVGYHGKPITSYPVETVRRINKLSTRLNSYETI